jgi:hypothetical protein
MPQSSGTSTLKIEAVHSSEILVSTRLYSVTSQNSVFKLIAMRISTLTRKIEGTCFYSSVIFTFLFHALYIYWRWSAEHPVSCLHAYSMYIITSLPITCTFSSNFRCYQLSPCCRIKHRVPSFWVLSSYAQVAVLAKYSHSFAQHFPPEDRDILVVHRTSSAHASYPNIEEKNAREVT